MSEPPDDTAAADIIADIAALARQLAETEPCRSASGPEALRALATRLDDLVVPPRRRRPPAIRVAVRAARKPAR